MYKKKLEEVFRFVKSSEEGLTSEEAKKRIEKNGKNILTLKKKESILQIFFGEFASPLTIILILTAIFSIIIGEVVDGIVISVIVLVDVIIGTVEEHKALKSAEALSQMLVTKATVLRDGQKLEISAEDLVIGDIIYLESGVKVSADARVIESSNLLIDEASLTGESLPVNKSNKDINKDVALGDRTNMIYTGTNVMSGRGVAVVVATGFATELGSIAKTVSETKEEKSPLTIRMERFSKQISIMILLIAVISSTILYINDYDIPNIILSVIALAVSAMPEGLSLAQTMALTVASKRMAEENVIVKKLNSVESLGSCTVIASDKTGTLTVNEQTAKKIVLASGKSYEITGTGYNVDGELVYDKDDKEVEKARKIASLCALNNEAQFKNNVSFSGDSIDIAFLVLKEKMGVEADYKVINEIPYESENQYSAVYYEDGKELRCTVKGSLEKVMSFSKENKKYLEYNEELTKEGYRVIAVADGKVKDKNTLKDLEFLGMVAFIDPVREEARYSVGECLKAGIKVLMVTGDHPNTSLAIAKKLEIATSMDQVITGLELEEAYRLGPSYFDEVVSTKRVFSRVTPTDKLHVVESLKRQGEFVAVTGDGVNDAPAIKAANIGIAMGSGTDVAKDTASMIIADDDFTSIVNGVREGRIAYANIRKITLFLLSCGFAEVAFYLLSVICGLKELPLIAIQLLWLNVVTDGLQDIALSFERNSKEIMTEPPRNTKESLFSKDLAIEVLIFGLTVTAMVFGCWLYLNKIGLVDKDVNYARSIIVMLMVFIQNIHVLNCRSEKNSVLTTKLIDNPLVLATIIGSIGLEVLFTFVPFLASILKISYIEPMTILNIFLFSLIIIVVAEIYKAIYRAIYNHKEENKVLEELKEETNN